MIDLRLICHDKHKKLQSMLDIDRMNGALFFFWSMNILSVVSSSHTVDAGAIMRGYSNSAMSLGSSSSRARRACLIKRVAFSTDYHCGWNNGPMMAFAVRKTHVPSLAAMSISRPIHRNIATSFPIQASSADVSAGCNDSPDSWKYDGIGLSQQSTSSSVITDGLNPSQQEATLRPRYSITRVIAGPGAGKTKVLTCRIAHLLLSLEDGEYGYHTRHSRRPEGILAVTFTKKAAMEMERRLSDLLSSSTEVIFKEEQSNLSSNDVAVPTNSNNEIIVVNGNADPSDDDEADDITRQLTRQVTVGTFHSVCSKILRKFGKELGNLPSVKECAVAETAPPTEDEQGVHLVNHVLVQTLDGSFNILDQSDQLRLLKDVLKGHNIELKSSEPLSGSGRNDDIRPITILNAISLLNTEDAILRTCQSSDMRDEISEETSKKISRKVRQIASEIRIPFQRAKYAQNSVDFDDLIFLTRELLLCHNEVREALHRRWRHILVDEFQDTSQIQLDLVRLMTTNSLFVVGDGDQSIYSWRGASPESMTDFELAFHNKMHGWEGLVDHSSIDLTQYYQQIDNMDSNLGNHGNSALQVKSVYLMENYRSTTNIVKAAQRVISSSEGKRSAAQDNIRREMKPMRGTGPSPRVLACKDAKAEANFVVKSVNEMVEGGVLTPASSVAIIYRTNAQSRLLEEACVEHNLRYVVRGSTGTFYKRAEIQDCLSFLKIMYNSRDRSAWARAVKAPSRGIGEQSLNEFFRYCDAVTEKYMEVEPSGIGPPSPMDVLLSLVSTGNSGNNIFDLVPPKQYMSTRSLNRFIPFASSLVVLREKLNTLPVNEYLMSVIEELNLKTHFDAISKTRDEFEDRLSNVMELIRAADRYKDDGPCISQDVNDTSESPLERFLDDVALIADIEPDTEDNSSGGRIVANLMTIHSSKGMEFDAVFLVGNEEGTFPTQKAIGQGEGSIELSEERRLCYVAMTRAKTHLVLTWRREVAYFAGNSFKTKDADRSRFLNVLVSKPDGKTSTPKIKSSADNTNGFRQKSSVGTRMIHSEATRNIGFSSSAQASSPPSHSNIKILEKCEPGRQAKSIQSHSPSRTQQKNWDNWEPTQQRKLIQQIPSIRPIKPPSRETRPQTTSRQIESASRPPTNNGHKTGINILRSRNNDALKDLSLSHVPSTGRNKENQLFQSDPPPQIDSTLFYPIGSSVKHKMYGRGIVQPPPELDEEFAEKLLVRVKFVDGDVDWDLPMDSLMHTYE
ncbi:hypothetical protein HJC23_005871 [Cyclotella cryptica]|uniref:DNA 3'-5' helicase n=1 Tax=Cyclotella cryptica TaxID=29204 RepID=A0ABD3QZW1_9STRA|eukprot:CCRYP_000404-RA/>CCRYP_000404-RA protein AED:0.04 eAED:0.04 QI:219/1/1/1/1/1/2/870/1245